MRRLGGRREITSSRFRERSEPPAMFSKGQIMLGVVQGGDTRFPRCRENEYGRGRGGVEQARGVQEKEGPEPWTQCVPMSL